MAPWGHNHQDLDFGKSHRTNDQVPSTGNFQEKKMCRQDLQIKKNLRDMLTDCNTWT